MLTRPPHPPTDASTPEHQPGPTPDRPEQFRYRAVWTLAVPIGVAVVVLLCSPARAHAETLLALAESVDAVLTNIRNWLMGILAGLATVFLTIGGVRYVAGGGDPGEAERAKAAFRSAAWGYGLAALAPLVVQILAGIVGA
jgi:hypothetical protein